jgi:hypothetical protein
MEKHKKCIKCEKHHQDGHKHHAKETKAHAKVEKVMHEWKEGMLHSGSKKGPIVKKKDQAVAIALSEARKMKKHKK